MEKVDFFTTPCWITALNLNTKELLKDIKKFSSKTESKAISNIGGYQGHDFPHQKFIDAVLENVPTLVNKPLTERKIYTWVNINRNNNYNQRHTHLDTNCFLSGVYYVKVPENSGNIRFYDPRGALIQGMPEHDYYHNGFAYHYLEPQEDMVIYFPSWLEHDVEPNESNKERVSIAFNVYATFDKKNPI